MVNFNKGKAEKIFEMISKFKGKKYPKNLEEAIKIKGVGEKIGTLYMLIAYGKSVGISVDVHCH